MRQGEMLQGGMPAKADVPGLPKLKVTVAPAVWSGWVNKEAAGQYVPSGMSLQAPGLKRGIWSNSLGI